MTGMKLQQYQKGSSNSMVIALVSLGVASVLLIGLSVWLFLQYNEEKNTVDAQIDAAAAKAEKEQADKDASKFLEKEKEPNKQFVGPDDYGRLTFSYPKTWNLYVASSTTESSGGFKAYLHPGFVPSIDVKDQRFALRVVIESTDFGKVVSGYDSLVEKGDLKSSQTSSNGQSGTRLDGNFSKDIRGAVVIYKVRDKTVSLFTDADTFKPDFENIIKTIKFNE
jgi:hypothetical protein